MRLMYLENILVVNNHDEAFLCIVMGLFASWFIVKKEILLKEVNQLIENPIRAEIYSVERLEEYATFLATEFVVGKGTSVSQPLLTRMHDNGDKLLNSYRLLAQDIYDKENISPAAEWLVDNFHIVEEQLREISQDLPIGFYKELPKLALGDLVGYPRVYAIALALVAHTDSCLETETIRRFVLAFQKVTPLGIGEIWALAITLRLVLVENLRRLSLKILQSREKRNQANQLTDQLIENINEQEKFKTIVSKISNFCNHSVAHDYAFIAQLAKRLRDLEAEYWPAVEHLEEHLAGNNSSIDRAVYIDHQMQASTQLSVANIITSMRLLSSLNWQNFFESVSLVDRILETDPEGSYLIMDFSTRDQYRHVIEKVAKRTGYSELTIARKVVQLAKTSQKGAPEDKKRSHVGYYLIDQGILKIEKEFKRKIRSLIHRIFLSHPTILYFGLIAGLLSLFYFYPINYCIIHGASFFQLLGIGLILFIPISDLCIGLTNFILTKSINPKRHPKIDLSTGIPLAGRTMIVIPCMLSNASTIEGLLEKIEIHYLGNNDPQLFFALLADFSDAQQQVMPEDNQLLSMAIEGINQLNEKYARKAESEFQDDITFYFFHRIRKWNQGEKTWMGWERKRGKLQEFNHLIRGGVETTFKENMVSPEFLKSIRFIITLDADTQLPRDTARKMIGTILHPLNRPHFDPKLARVTEGYGVLQPRISISLESSSRSYFAKIFSGYVGIDPYTTAISDIYQDLFNEGSYVGKGLYDVDAFEAALKGRVPDNTILSHDLFEGLYSRVALLTDVELLDDYPQSYDTFFKRQHRWIRGDWQISPWLFPFVRNEKNKWVRSYLPFIAKWKIFDNLRRSMVAPALLLYVLLGLTVFPGAPFFWLCSSFLIILFPTLTNALSGIITVQRSTHKTSFVSKWNNVTNNLIQAVFYIIFLAHQAFISVDAITRVLYRTLISKTKRMEWVTAAQTEKNDTKIKKTFWQTYWPTELLILIFATLIILYSRDSIVLAGPVLLLWASYPLVAMLLGRKMREKHQPLINDDKQLLRQIARRTWNYFDTFVTQDDNSLPPDNFQEDPDPVIAHRTSPTNIGIYLLSVTAARDFGYLCSAKLIRLLRATLSTMQKLEQHEGHYYNWYDTQSLQPLHPKYISTVDSGNLAGYLLAVKQVCLDIPSSMVIDAAFIDGLKDTLSIIDSERSSKEILRCFEILELPPETTFSAWSLRLKSLYLSLTNLRDVNDKKDILFWIEACISQVKELQQYLTMFAPWVVIDLSYLNDKNIKLINETLDKNTTFFDFIKNYEIVINQFKKVGGEDSIFLTSLTQAKGKVVELMSQSEELAQSFNHIFEKMNFTFLLEKEKVVFSIGYNCVDHKLDNSFYDLLASESRLASFIAIAKGDVEQKHWFQLGRQLVPTKNGRALISWSASMFEYLMPLLVMQNYENTLLSETLNTILLKQISYGKEHEVPWGISESGYNSRDLQFNYQYGPFGIPGLGLKRGLSHDLVISPYSTLLASMVMPDKSIDNLKRLIKQQMLSVFGFYEAIDYTAERRPEKQKFAIIKSFMAHHQGMSFVALNNVINNNISQYYFHKEPCVKATRLLLQERIPSGVITVFPKVAHVEVKTEHLLALNPFIRQYKDPNSPTPRVQLLSNGDYSIMITSSGSGYSKCNHRVINRWREDPTRDNCGSYIFIKNMTEDLVWSATYHPLTQVTADSYEVTFNEHKVEFDRRDGDISSHTEILVAPEDNVEIRYLTLTNHADVPRILEITSYLEPVLSAPQDDLSHLAFSKLFVQTEFFPPRNTLLAKRRKRSITDEEVWGIHTVVSDSQFISDIQFETDREKFIGRGRSLLNPLAIETGNILSNSEGSTLDPILSLRVRIRLSAGEVGHIAFTTGMTTSREEALELSDRYHDINSFERESKLAWTRSQVDLHHLNIDAKLAYLFHRLAEKIIFSDPTLRPPTHLLKMNANMQQKLWPYGISGDLPIVVISISAVKDLIFIRKLLRCHEYLRLKGLSYDFVILNEHGPAYFQDLNDEINLQIKTTGSQVWLNRPGGVFVLRSDITPKDHMNHIQAVARVSLFADRPLKEQIDRKILDERYPPMIIPPIIKTEYRIQDLPIPDFKFFNDFGGFSQDGREYIIILKPGVWTPAPWINVIGNNNKFGFQISEVGSGFTWSVNSQANRLTPWSNDPVIDPSGEIIYLRDEEEGEYWCPTPLPILAKSNFIIKHGIGYSSFEHICNEIHSTLTCFVPLGDSIKISILKLKNLTTKKRTISITSYTEWVLGSQRQKSSPSLICEQDQETGAIFAQNPFDNEFANRIAFADISNIDKTFTCSRKEFLGRNGNYARPLALNRQGLNSKNGTGQDPCAILQSIIELLPNESYETIIVLGQCDDKDKARELALRYRDHALVKTSFDEVTKYWNGLVSTIQVKTPDDSTNIMMNSWLFYQNLSCRFWARSAFYQSGGAFGFRDQLQDCMALVYAAPHLTREHILLASSRQFNEGDVQHWWHPPTGRGVRTRMTDDLLWLPYVVSYYINITGDISILDEMRPFIVAPLLNQDQEDSYTYPQISSESVTLFEHCARAIDRSLSLGEHGIPLIGTGDWNDGMNAVGVHGKGESIWLGWFLYKVIKDFLPFCYKTEQNSRKETYHLHMKKLKLSLEKNGWDGQWYRRAYFDDGSALGSSLNEECQIDSIAQTWSVLSGAGEIERTKIAMKKVEEFLVNKEAQIILLLTPPFDKSSTNPGYIKGYVPGVRENGGQYTHAAVWTVMAFAQISQRNTAMELFKMLNPINHSKNKAESEVYKIEPYVLAGDVYAGDTHAGRGGWSWYTGSAAWYYRAGLESLLGFCLRNKKLVIKPCIPNSWKSYEITYNYGATKYCIKIENPDGENYQGISQVYLDGDLLSEGEIEIIDDAKEHNVVVKLLG